MEPISKAKFAVKEASKTQGIDRAKVTELALQILIL